MSSPAPVVLGSELPLFRFCEHPKGSFACGQRAQCIPLSRPSAFPLTVAERAPPLPCKFQVMQLKAVCAKNMFLMASEISNVTEPVFYHGSTSLAQDCAPHIRIFIMIGKRTKEGGGGVVWERERESAIIATIPPSANNLVISSGISIKSINMIIDIRILSNLTPLFLL